MSSSSLAYSTSSTALSPGLPTAYPDSARCFDSTVDRVSEAVVLLGLLAYYLSRDDDVGSILVYAAIIGSIMVSYLRARSEGLGIDCRVGVMTRPERVAVVGIGLIVGYWEPRVMLLVLGIIALLTAFTAVHRLIHTWRMLKSEDEGMS